MFGFGHRVYKNFDPRANVIRKVAEEVFELVGRDPLIDVAVALEKEAEKTRTSSNATCTRTWTFTADSCTAPWGSPPSSSPCSSPCRRRVRVARAQESLRSTRTSTTCARSSIDQGVAAPDHCATRAPCSRPEHVERRAPPTRRGGGWRAKPSRWRRRGTTSVDGGHGANLAVGSDSTAQGERQVVARAGARAPVILARFSAGVVAGDATRTRRRARAGLRASEEERRRLPSVEGSEPRLDGKRCFLIGRLAVSLSSVVVRCYTYDCMYIVLTRSGFVHAPCLPVHHARPRKPTELPVPRGLSGVLRLPRALEHRPAPRDARVAHPDWRSKSVQYS